MREVSSTEQGGFGGSTHRGGGDGGDNGVDSGSSGGALKTVVVQRKGEKDQRRGAKRKWGKRDVVAGCFKGERAVTWSGGGWGPVWGRPHGGGGCGGGGPVTRWRQWGGRLLWSSVVEEVRLVKFVASWSPSTK
jgi:hypothetical protein